jgi:hypothetical protein
LSYSKQDLLGNLIEFKKKHNRYPTTEDFEKKKITPTRKAFYRKFGNMKKAFGEADLFEKGELVFIQEKKVSRRPTPFGCPFCGSYLQKPFDYATCKHYIIIRFMELLNNNNNRDYSNAVFDCFLAVFGPGNLEAENALRKEGFLKEYLERQESMNNKIIYCSINRED